MLKFNSFICIALAVLAITAIQTISGVKPRRFSRQVSIDNAADNNPENIEKRNSKKTPASGELASDLSEWMKGEIETIKMHRAQLGLKSNNGSYYKLHKRPANKVKAEQKAAGRR